ncbi:MAG: sigma-70 family RNA polymerase sigma factor [Candidatus Latescibacteria bacterium]|nr:sigma-70 family RNA polymerase sigma factor [Candidatus Latescibacterota bacterium]
METIAQLVDQARNAQLARRHRHRAFARLVERFQDMVYGMAWAAVGDQHRAQDLAQDIFLAAFLDLEALGDAAAFPGWLRRLAQRHCARARPQPLPEDVPAPSSPPAPDAALHQHHTRTALRQALAALPENQRQILVLFYLGQYSQREIAAFFDLTLAAVKKRLQRARAHLQEIFTTMLSDDLQSQRPSRTPQFANHLLDMLHAADPVSAFAPIAPDERPNLTPLVGAIRAAAAQLHNSDLATQTQALRRQAQDTSLDELLPSAYALVLEAQRRRQGPAWEDEHLLEGILLHHGQAVALSSPEQRLHLVALPLVLNALSQQGAHFLAHPQVAQQAATLMSPLLADLGFSGQFCDENTALRGDINFCPLSKIAFDFLYHRLGYQSQAPQLHYALIDQIDQLLIAEHATPLVVSGATADWSPAPYQQGIEMARALVQAEKNRPDNEEPFYTVDRYNVEFSPRGQAFMQNHRPDLVAQAPRVLNQLVRGLVAYQPGRDYAVHQGRVVILGREGNRQSGRRFSDGLHQALEAVEGLEIQPETENLASIGYRDFYQLYQRLAGLVVH